MKYKKLKLPKEKKRKKEKKRIKAIKRFFYYFKNKYSDLKDRFRDLSPMTILIISFVMLITILIAYNHFIQPKLTATSETVMNLIYEWEGNRTSMDFVTIMMSVNLCWAIVCLKYRPRKPQVYLTK